VKKEMESSVVEATLPDPALVIYSLDPVAGL
jgi:hypothetical protein